MLLPTSHGGTSSAVEVVESNRGLLGNGKLGPNTDFPDLDPNSFATLDPEVPVPSSLGASTSRSYPEVHAPLSSVLSPSPVASTSGSNLHSPPTHWTVRVSETPASSSATLDSMAGLGLLGPTSLLGVF